VISTVSRMSDKERSPFLRTIKVWEERSVYSASYIERLLEACHARVDTPATGSGERGTPRTLLHGDARISGWDEIGQRLIRQSAITQHQVKKCESALWNIDTITTDPTVGAEVTDAQSDVVSSLLTSLSAEISVCL
jgi:hypothetical protein